MTEDIKPADDKSSKSYDQVLREQLITAAEEMAQDDVGMLNLKIAGTAVRELHQAFAVFRPFIQRRKVTIFGSARTPEDSELYEAARAVAAELSTHDWMTVTGAGPGIMKAGMVGAGESNALGVTIQLPFESSEGAALVDDKYVSSMKYFFTRKLMLCKESHAFVCMPGGFGTQDETFEQLTLMQTGKASITPLVLLDSVSGTYWSSWFDWCRDHLVAAGLIDKHDMSLLYVTNTPADAVAHIKQFYRNYNSSRWAGGRLVVRLSKRPSSEQLQDLNEKFGHICTSGSIEECGPSRAELYDQELLDLPRISFAFNKKSNGELRELIDHINLW